MSTTATRQTNAGIASEMLTRYNELSGGLAAHAARLLKTASSGDEVGTRQHQRALSLWCGQQLLPTLDAAAEAAHRMIATSRPDAGVAVVGQIVALRETIRELDEAPCARDAAVETIHLRLHLHQLVRVLERHAVSGLLDGLHGGHVDLAPAC